MSTRRSRPPRNRKSRKPEAPQDDVVVTVPPDSSVERSEVRAIGGLTRETSPAGTAASDELAALDAGWD
jgi:hypothetical protein